MLSHLTFGISVEFEDSCQWSLTRTTHASTRRAPGYHHGVFRSLGQIQSVKLWHMILTDSSSKIKSRCFLFLEDYLEGIISGQKQQY